MPPLNIFQRSINAILVSNLIGLPCSHAATITVDNSNDVVNNLACSFRDAIVSINTQSIAAGCNVIGSFGDDDRIEFSLLNPSTITLGSVLPPIVRPTVIDGPGQDSLTLNGNQTSQVFVFDSAAIAINDLTIANANSQVGSFSALENSEVSFNRVIIRNSSGTISGGGYVGAAAKATFNDAIIRDNFSLSGAGGLTVTGGSLLLSNSQLLNNTSQFKGGGIALRNGELNITAGSLISNNEATFSGGGIYATGSSTENLSRLHISDSVLLANSIGSLDVTSPEIIAGGGVFAKFTYFTMQDNTVVQSNGAFSRSFQKLVRGAGVALEQSPGAIIEDSLITDNTMLPGSFGGWQGIGIHIEESDGIKILNSTISLNEGRFSGGTGEGGGIFIGESTNIVIEKTRIVNNKAIQDGTRPSSGGGIFFKNLTSNEDNLRITDSVISNNSAWAEGGGLYTRARGINIVSTTISGNSASRGGGVAFKLGGGQKIDSSLIADNKAASCGGGISVYTSTIPSPRFMVNTTVSGNTSSNGGGLCFQGAFFGFGGAQGVIKIKNSTVSMNTASNRGGGMYNRGITNRQVLNSLITGNRAIAPRVYIDGFGDLYGPYGTGDASFSDAYSDGVFWAGNVIGDASNELIDGISRGVRLPLLKSKKVAAKSYLDGNVTAFKFGSHPRTLNSIIVPLNDNGGTTLTHAIPTFSIADNAGIPGFCEPMDQRGETRGAPNCDIGAYENPNTEKPPRLMMFNVIKLKNGKHAIIGL